MITNPFAMKQTSSKYRWVMRFFCAWTPLCVVTLPGLSLIEVGTNWGASSFAGIFFELIGDTLEGRFGTHATLFAACFMTGAFGLAHSFAPDYISLLVASLPFGIAQAIIPIMLFKVARQLFPAERLGYQ